MQRIFRRGVGARRATVACLAAGACFAGSALTAGPAGAAVSFGSDLAGTPTNQFNCDVDNQCTVGLAALDPALDAPGGFFAPSDGVIVRWRVEVGTSSGPINLRVLRPEGGGQFSGQGTSGAQVTPPTGQETTFATRIPVEQNDRIGLDCCESVALPMVFKVVGAGQATSNFFNPVLGTAPAAPFAQNTALQLFVNADLEADADGDGFGDETQDNCVGSAGPNDGCPDPVVPITTPVTPLTTPTNPQTAVTTKRCKKPKKGKKSVSPYAKKKGCKKKKK